MNSEHLKCVLTVSNPGFEMLIRLIQELKWCPSQQCEQNPLKNPDMVGSINIMKKGMNIETPNPLFSKENDPWKHTTLY